MGCGASSKGDAYKEKQPPQQPAVASTSAAAPTVVAAVAAAGDAATAAAEDGGEGEEAGGKLNSADGDAENLKLLEAGVLVESSPELDAADADNFAEEFAVVELVKNKLGWEDSGMIGDIMRTKDSMPPFGGVLTPEERQVLAATLQVTTVTFEKGDVGFDIMEFEPDDVLVDGESIVSGGQAEEKGVKGGWTITKLNDVQCTKRLFDQLVAASKGFTITRPKVPLAGLKRLLLILNRAGFSHFDEVKAMLANVAFQMQLPGHWDINSMRPDPLSSNAGVLGDQGVDSFEADDDAPINLTAKVAVDTNEFQSLMDKSFRKKYTRDRRGGKVPERLRVVSVNRIQNAQSWKEYMAKLKGIQMQCEAMKKETVTVEGYAVEDLKTAGHLEELLIPDEKSTNTVWLFHGTSAKGAEGIGKNDFRLDLSGSNAGTLYGKGIYLAESSAKSDEYTEVSADGVCHMLVCRATLGTVFYCDEKQPDADALVSQCVKGPYNSVLGDREKIHNTFREFMVYNEDQVYTEFVISYVREYADVESPETPCPESGEGRLEA